MAVIDALNERMSNLGTALESVEDRKLVEVERAVITLANRVQELRADFDTLVCSIAAG